MPTRPRNFCMITTFYPPYHFGGEAMYLYRLVNALARRGHHVTVVHCFDSYRLLTKAGSRGDFPHHENVTVHTLRSSWKWLSPLVTYLTGQPGLKSPALDRIFRDQPFDVVHFHLVTLFGPGVLRYGSEALRLYTTHDHWLVCPMYDLWKQKRELCETPACIRCQFSNNRPPQLWRYSGLLDQQLPKVDLFLSPSRSTIHQHQRRGFAYPMTHLPYFLPLAETSAQPRPTPAAGARPYFLFVGRLVKIKGLQTLFSAFRQYPHADLLIAGDGDYEPELRRLAEGLDHVHFLGRKSPAELAELYRGAIALLVPAMVYETFGFITLESLGQRTPVIANDLGAVAEVVRDTGGGLTYQTEAELLGAMHTLQSDPELRTRLGETGHEAYANRYSEDAHIAAYLGAIEGAEAVREGARPPKSLGRGA